MDTLLFSIIIPVYNRPDELKELLDSLVQNRELKSAVTDVALDADNGIIGDQAAAFGMEVIVVEDGSRIRSKEVCDLYSSHLDLHYLYQENTGPAGARNNGARVARGEWLLFFDSDCLIPPGYFEAVMGGITSEKPDFFGGPDRASDDFTPVQKAIDYAMTSFLTTGGIRGGRRRLDRYYPRSFNKGVRKEAYDAVGGFSALRFGEDLDLSMRLMKAGYRSVLIPDAWVYHKRRTDLKKFFKQVYNSGMARVVLNRLHPGTMKGLHLLPSFFVVYLLLAVAMLPAGHLFLLWPLLLFILALFVHGWSHTRSFSAAVLVPPASLVQLSGYGSGLWHALFLIYLLGRKEARAFEKTFYK